MPQNRVQQWRRRNLHGIIRVSKNRQPARDNSARRIANNHLLVVRNEGDEDDEQLWEDIPEWQDSADPIMSAQHTPRNKKRPTTEAFNMPRLNSIAPNPSKRVKHNRLELQGPLEPDVSCHQHPASLMGLPLELREMIYDYAMINVDEVFVWEDYSDETSDFFHPKSCQRFHTFIKYMMRYPDFEAFRAMRYLALSGDVHLSYLGLPPNGDIWSANGFIAIATSLRGLSLSLESTVLARYNRRLNKYTRPLTIDEIIAKRPGFQEVVKSPKLENLTLICEPVESDELAFTCNVEELYTPLLTWLRNEFEQGGKDVQVQVILEEEFSCDYADVYASIKGLKLG